MRILFVTRHFGCLRNFERAIGVLAAAGHELQLVALQDDILGGEQLVAGLAAHPTVTVARGPVRPRSGPGEVAVKLRLALDYLRYLAPAYASAPRLRQRAWERTPRGVLALLRVAGVNTAPGRRVLAAGLRALERALPRAEAVGAYLAAARPDVVLLTPLIGLGSPELDYFLEAKALGLRTVFCVWSWDNLSSKAFLRAVPDVVTVWNETQKREVVELHGISAARVVVTGAQCFDHWFEWAPQRTREEFCRRVGLPAEQPFVVYVCSALFHGSPVEAEFVTQWLREIRQESSLREVAVLVRPHPSRRKEWERVSLDGVGPVALWGANPIDGESRADYFESLYYSAAVVGLNTSAMVEAAIVGRPVLTILLPEFRENQEGTLHFPYLLTVNGGLLHVARDWTTHRAQLAGALADPAAYTEKSRRFVEAFLRPHGLGVSGTEMFVAAVERVFRQPPPLAVDPLPAWNPARWVFRAVQVLAGEPVGQHLLMDPVEAEEGRIREQRLAADRSAKARRRREREAAMAERERLRQVLRHDLAAEKAERRRQKEGEKRARIKAKRLETARLRRQRLRDLIARRVKRLTGVPDA